MKLPADQPLTDSYDVAYITTPISPQVFELFEGYDGKGDRFIHKKRTIVDYDCFHLDSPTLAIIQRHNPKW